MATHAGREGAIYVGVNQVAELMDWSFEDSIDLIDDSELADIARTYLTGKSNATGSFNCHWDETDTTGQQALTLGASVTLNLYMEGNTTGDAYFTGTAIITGRSYSGSDSDTIKASYNWTSNGGMTQSTV